MIGMKYIIFCWLASPIFGVSICCATIPRPIAMARGWMGNPKIAPTLSGRERSAIQRKGVLCSSMAFDKAW